MSIDETPSRSPSRNPSRHPSETDDEASSVTTDDTGFAGDPFFELGLAPTIVDDIAGQGLTVPTPIQKQAIPAILDGRDLIGLAQTGTGKTAAYLLPLLHGLLQKRKAKLARRTSILILVPTRELAYQVSDSIKAFSASLKTRYLTICGGERYDFQLRALKKGVDVIVATPGRFEDLQAKGKIDLGQIEHFVLDEGDQMIDLGFLPPIKRIFKALPPETQTVFFSATMPEEMKTLAETFLTDPVTIRAAQAGQTVDAINQRAILVRNADKRNILLGELSHLGDEPALVFVRTRLRADELARWLTENGVDADALHGDMRQFIRQKVLRRFKTGALRVLVATDVAARGIDVSGLGMVVNFDLPEMVESYVHRIGRTGRAGQAGTALSICSVADQEKLSAILSHVGQKLDLRDSDGTEIIDFMPEKAPRKARGRGRPPRHFRDRGKHQGQSRGKAAARPADGSSATPSGKTGDKSPVKASGKPSGKSFSKPSGKSFGKPSGKRLTNAGGKAGGKTGGKPPRRKGGKPSGERHERPAERHTGPKVDQAEGRQERAAGVLSLPSGSDRPPRRPRKGPANRAAARPPGKPGHSGGKRSGQHKHRAGPSGRASGPRAGGQQDGGSQPLRRRQNRSS